MPKKRFPKDELECEKWITAIEADDGRTVEGVSRDMKYRLRSNFYVAKAKGKSLLMDIKTKLPVFIENQFDELWKTFHVERNHPCDRITKKLMDEVVTGVPESMITAKRKEPCRGCQIKGVVPKAPIGKPIRSSQVWGRVEVDLIDMSSLPDGEFKYILHAKDHLSKFSYAAPLRRKSMDDVAAEIRKMFHLYGPPQILQNDNGGEFVGRAVTDMLKNEFPQIKNIRSAPRRPNTNGVIENANGCLERRIMTWRDNTGRSDWAASLQEIVYKRNLETTRTTGCTAYEMFFARKHHTAADIVSLEDDDPPTVDPQNEPAEPDGYSRCEGQMHLLYKYDKDESKAVAIGKLIDARPTQGVFEIVELLCDDEKGSNDEPLTTGSIVVWDLSRATSGVGNTTEEIEFRSKYFENYLKNRRHQREEWIKKASRHQLEIGDHVLLPINDADRGKTCPKALEAQVVMVDKEFVRVGTEKAGVITTWFRKDILRKVEGKVTPFNVPDNMVTFVRACRLETSYSLKRSKRVMNESQKTVDHQVTAKRRRSHSTSPLPKRSAQDLLDESDDDFSDFEITSSQLKTKWNAVKEKVRKAKQLQFRFKSVNDRRLHYLPAFTSSLSDNCRHHLLKVYKREITSEYNDKWTKNRRKSELSKNCALNAIPLVDGDYMEKLVRQLFIWQQSFDGQKDNEDNQGFSAERNGYVWSVMLPEAVRYGLRNGLNMTHKDATDIMSDLELAEEEINELQNDIRRKNNIRRKAKS